MVEGQIGDVDARGEDRERKVVYALKTECLHPRRIGKTRDGGLQLWCNRSPVTGSGRPQTKTINHRESEEEPRDDVRPCGIITRNLKEQTSDVVRNIRF